MNYVEMVPLGPIEMMQPKEAAAAIGWAGELGADVLAYQRTEISKLEQPPRDAFQDRGGYRLPKSPGA